MTRVADDEFVLDTDGGFGPVMVARLERFRLRTKVEFEPLDWVCAAVRGPEATRGVTGSPGAGRSRPPSPRSAGVDLLGPLPDDGLDAWVADAVVTAARRRPGRPAASRPGCPSTDGSWSSGTIAAEVGLVDRTVSFTKGCFTGQELVARLDARGSKVARHLRGVVLTGPADDGDDPEPGATPTRWWARRCSPPTVTTRWVTCPRWPGRRALGAPVALATLHRRIEPARGGDRPVDAAPDGGDLRHHPGRGPGSSPRSET